VYSHIIILIHFTLRYHATAPPCQEISEHLYFTSSEEISKAQRRYQVRYHEKNKQDHDVLFT